jgi:anti-sigma factor RsiW
MSDTPQTDAAKEGGESWMELAALSAVLERENAALRAALDQQANYHRELRADRDRLDWLARNRSVSIKERPLFVTPESLRAAIDAELEKEAQP